MEDRGRGAGRTHALGAHTLVDQTKSSCPPGWGPCRSRVTWERAQSWQERGARNLRRAKRGRGTAACLAQGGSSGGARTRAPAARGQASRGRRVRRPLLGKERGFTAQGPGDRVRCSGPWDLRGARRPSPPPPLPRTSAARMRPELRCGGAPACPGAATRRRGCRASCPRELDKGDLCEARCWGRASPPPGPARPRAGGPPPDPYSRWGLPCRLRIKGPCGWRGRGCHRSGRPTP